MNKTTKLIISLCLLNNINNLNACMYDAPLFYRAKPYFGEPRLDKPYLTTADFYFSGGDSHCSFNRQGCDTSLLNLYGPHNMKDLGKGINLDTNNYYDSILSQLAIIDSKTDFGKLLFKGNFEIFEFVFNFVQNLDRGFFVELNIPIRKIKITTMDYEDLSPDSGEYNINTPVWQQFLTNFDAILARFCINKGVIKKSGAGNLSLIGGYTWNYENTTHLDFIDMTMRIGVQLPTDIKKNPNRSFDVSTGYDKLTGVPLIWDFSIGMFEWLTLGARVDALFLIDKNQTLRLKSAFSQNGFIKLAKNKVKVCPGTAWDLGFFVKADHIISGLSLYLGYTYTKKDGDVLVPCNNDINSKIINSDPIFHQWSMKTLNIYLEYDFAYYQRRNAPRIAFCYNKVLGGKNIFKTNTGTGYLSLDFDWNF